MTQRNHLISRMEELEAAGFGCKGCAGTCCTYEANSMMITESEARALLPYVNAYFIERCKETVQKFRLDVQTGNGRRAFIRRTYTCPFFNNGELGCPLPREVKPYGCLAFNAHHAELKAGEHCYSETNLLEQIQDDGPKLPLPVALIEIWGQSRSLNSSRL